MYISLADYTFMSGPQIYGIILCIYLSCSKQVKLSDEISYGMLCSCFAVVYMLFKTAFISYLLHEGFL